MDDFKAKVTHQVQVIDDVDDDGYKEEKIKEVAKAVEEKAIEPVDNDKPKDVPVVTAEPLNDFRRLHATVPVLYYCRIRNINHFNSCSN